jgi:hypothetical protein
MATLRDVQTALRSAPIQRRGATVECSLTLKTDEATLKPFFVEMERVAIRQQGMNNLRQIGIAMFNHEAAYQTFPNGAICDKTGKPLLSWRVALLPFFEEDNLYKQFKFDEPWDSPNNIKLLDKMPNVYSLPGREAKKGETFIRVFTGQHAAFDLSRPGGNGSFTPGRKIFSFTDGTSNTLLVVEAAESVPWTKPDELPVDPKKTLPKLGGLLPDKFLAVLADGSVEMIPTKIGEKTLRNLIDPADGNVIDWEKIVPGRFKEDRRVPPAFNEAPKPPPQAKEPERRP